MSLCLHGTPMDDRGREIVFDLIEENKRLDVKAEIDKITMDNFLGQLKQKDAEIERLEGEVKHFQANEQNCLSVLSEGAVKDRALDAACISLNDWATREACLGPDPDDLVKHIGRTLDQCRNARHGKLSTNPWPDSASTRLDPLPIKDLGTIQFNDGMDDD